MTPRTHAIAYRIWAYAAPREWDVTIGEVAEELDLPRRTVKSICIHRGWNERMRIMGLADFQVRRHRVTGMVYGEFDEVMG